MRLSLRKSFERDLKLVQGFRPVQGTPAVVAEVLRLAREATR